MIAALLPLLLAGQIAAAPVALRVDPPAITQAEARDMTPAALGDALLAPGHPPIVERIMLPEGLPPLPGGSPLTVQLVGVATLDRASGFCVKRSWRIDGTVAGEVRALTAGPLRYRLPSPRSNEDPCEEAASAFFTVESEDRSRAFEVVRWIAAAIRLPKRLLSNVTVDDQEGRERLDWQRSHPHVADTAEPVLIDPVAALAALPLDRISYIGHRADRLLSAAELTAPNGRRYEDWQLYANDWTIHVAFDGDRMVGLRLRRRIPPPF